MPDAPPEAVVFDLGRVLVDLDWSAANGAAGRRAGLDAAEVGRRIFAKTDFFGLETGRVGVTEYHAQVERALGVPLPFAEFRRLWNSIFPGEIAATVALARRLHRSGRVRVAILSNTNVLHAEELRARMDILRELEHVYLSHEIGFRKPDPAAYRHVLGRLELEAARVVFVDDLPANVAAARAVGMDAVLAQSPAAVLEGLRALGLPVDDATQPAAH